MAIAQLTSRIDAVKIYAAGATIARIAALRLTPDSLPEQVEIAGLPLALDDTSVRVRVEIDGGNVPIASDIRIGLAVPPPSETPNPPADEELRAAKAEVQRLEDIIALINNEIAVLSGLEVPNRPDGETGKAPPPSPMSARLALANFSDEQIRARMQEKRETLEMLRQAQENLAYLQLKQTLASTAKDARPNELRKTAIVSLTYEGEFNTEQQTQLVIEYFVPGARWTPTYVCRLDSANSTANIAVRALICQRTGEDWSGVRLELSTALPMAWCALPELPSLRLGKSQPMVRKTGWRRPPIGAEILFEDYDLKKKIAAVTVAKKRQAINIFAPYVAPLPDLVAFDIRTSFAAFEVNTHKIEFDQEMAGFNQRERELFLAMKKAQRQAEVQEQAKDDLQRQVIRLMDDVEGAARGDLTAQAEVTADIFGGIADAFNLTIQNLRDVLQKLPPEHPDRKRFRLPSEQAAPTFVELDSSGFNFDELEFDAYGGNIPAFEDPFATDDTAINQTLSSPSQPSRKVAKKRNFPASPPPRAELMGRGLSLRSNLPADITDDVSNAIAYGLMRLGAAEDTTKRGKLSIEQQYEAYLEILQRQKVVVNFDIKKVVKTAVTKAESCFYINLPPGGINVREVAAAFDYAYSADGRIDIPSDGQFHSVALTNKTTNVDVRYIVVPREDTNVFRIAELRNPLPAPLLSGSADVYVDGEYILSTNIATVPPKGNMEIGLGVEQAIKVARNTSYQESRAGTILVAFNEMQHKINIEIANRLSKEALIEVRERIPVAQEGAKVDVQINQVTPAWEKYEQEERGTPIRGGYRWRVKVPGGRKAILSADYTIKTYVDSEIVGGNRRE